MSTFSQGGWGTPDVSNQRNVGAWFAKADKLTHVYDFGTESVTKVRGISNRQGTPLSRHPIVLMARNVVPQVFCIECDDEASHLCHECQVEWESPGTLCAQHAPTHPHDRYGEPIEIVNSPRLGLCGYAGPAEPPC